MTKPVERELPWSWHRSPGWQGQLDRVHRWHHRLLHAANPSDAEDYLYAFFQNCYHLRDWLQSQEHNKAEVETLFQNHVEFQLCRDVCNMTKHFELDRPPATGKEPSLAREYAGVGQGWFDDNSTLVILSDGKKYDARDVASKCLERWEIFFQTYEPHDQ